MRIDTSLVRTLRRLRRVAAGETHNLALRNLLRAKMLRLATGQQMARFLRSKGVAVTTLKRPRSGTARRRRARAAHRSPARRVPRGHSALVLHLARGRARRRQTRGVGARIVAETFHRAMEGSEFSIVATPTWRRSWGPTRTRFGWSTSSCSPRTGGRR